MKIKRNLLKASILLGIIGIAIFGSSSASPTRAEKTEKSDLNYVNGTLIVKAEDEEILKSYGEVTKVTDEIYIVNTDSPEAAKDATENLKGSSQITAIIPDVEAKLQSVSNPENYAWGVKATGSDHYIDWLNYLKENKGKNPKNLVVAVLDSGIYKDHEVFSDESGKSRLCSGNTANYAKSYDHNTTTNETTITEDVTDPIGHGTGVAGIIAESTPNSVCILPVQITKSADKFSFANVLLALSDVSKVSDIINMSLGVISDDLTDEAVNIINDFLRDIEDTYKVTMVAAAGNESRDTINYPASSPYTIAVSALKQTASGFEFDTRYSNYGAGMSFSMPGSALTLPSIGGTYSEGQHGTSFATPQLSAAAALLRSDPEYDYTGTTNFNSTADVFTGLKNNATYLGEETTSKWDNHYGYGMVNFEENMFNPGRVSVTSEIDPGTNSAAISIYALGAKPITNYAITKSTATPTESEWKTIENPTTYGNSYITGDITENITKNGTYYAWIKNDDGKVKRETVTISGIDESIKADESTTDQESETTDPDTPANLSNDSSTPKEDQTKSTITADPSSQNESASLSANVAVPSNSLPSNNYGSGTPSTHTTTSATEETTDNSAAETAALSGTTTETITMPKTGALQKTEDAADNLSALTTSAAVVIAVVIGIFVKEIFFSAK